MGATPQPNQTVVSDDDVLRHPWSAGLKPWTTHELVQQVDGSLRRMWPRAQSKLYEEPKKLVAHGLARATDDSVGKRRRTRYTITARGRRALAAWLQEPGGGPILEFEQLLKISFADKGSKADITTNLAATRAWVLDQNEEHLATARAYLEGRGAYPERAALNQLAGRFLTDFYVMVAHWVDWASQLIETWPDDVRDAPYDVAAAEESVRLAESVARVSTSASTTNRRVDGSSGELPMVIAMPPGRWRAGRRPGRRGTLSPHRRGRVAVRGRAAACARRTVDKRPRSRSASIRSG